MDEQTIDPLSKRRTFPRGTATRVVKVHVSEDEHERLQLRARQSDMPVSEYMVACGLQHTGGMTTQDARRIGTVLLDIAERIGAVQVALSKLNGEWLSGAERVNLAVKLRAMSGLQREIESAVDRVVLR